MIKNFWKYCMAIVCIVVLPLLQSCDNNDGYSIGDFTPPLWATVRTTSNSFYLDCDTWGTLWPVNTDWGWYRPADGQRVIVTFNPLSDEYAGYDHAVKILDMREVLTKPLEILTDSNDVEFGNDPINVLKDGTGISNAYFNMFFLQNLPTNNVKHRVSLVRPANDEQLYGKDGYLHLQLRYNDYNDLSGIYTPPVPVSFSLKSLEISSQCKGIKIHLNSAKNGPVELTYDIVHPDTARTIPAAAWSELKQHVDYAASLE